MSGLFKCGICDFLYGLIRRIMCVRNRRGSNDSCYREATGGEESVRLRSIPSITSATDTSTDFTITTTISPFLDFDGTGRLTFAEELELILEEDVPLRSTNRPLDAFFTIKRQQTSRKEYGLSPNALAISCYSKMTDVLLSRAGLWEFDTFHLDRATGGHCIPAIGMFLFEKYELIQHFNLKPENCLKLFKLIETNYHLENAYHNSMHASDVTQAVHVFVQEAALLHIMRKTEILAVLLAALTHDLDHPGVSKSFLLATKHPIAVIYKDQEMAKNVSTTLQRQRKAKDNQATTEETSSGIFRRKKKETDGSILECHHWKVAYSCILQSGIFSHMSTRLPEIKKLLKELIVATDISRQEDYLKLFKSFLTLKNLDMRLPEHRLLVLQIALKTADISNPGRPWSISRKWSCMVCEEFFLQGDQERKMQIPITLFCDRKNDTIPCIQIGFINNVVKPLYTAWHHYLRSELTLKMMTNLVHNAAEWKRESDRSKWADAMTPLNHSASTECLLKEAVQETGARAPRSAPRRRSYSPTRSSAVKDALRRFSSPLQALVSAPRILSEVLLREEHPDRRPPPPADYISLARRTPRCSTEENRVNCAAGAKPKPKSDSANGVDKFRLGAFVLAGYDSDSCYTTSPGSLSNSCGPQRLSTVTSNLSTPSSETRFDYPLVLDNASCVAGSCEAVVQHMSTRKECSDILTSLVPPVTRRRDSAPVVATPMPRPQIDYAESRKLSASFAACHLISEGKPLVRRGSLPVITGISAL